MSDIYRYEMRRDNDQIVDRHGRWGVDLSTVWTWIGDVLATAPGPGGHTLYGVAYRVAP